MTGSNKGIGFEVVKGLCEKFPGIVYLTARSTERGEAAVDKLKSLGLNPKFHQLDITNQNSIDEFRDYIKNTYGGFDLLINNAAVAYQVRNICSFNEKTVCLLVTLLITPQKLEKASFDSSFNPRNSQVLPGYIMRQIFNIDRTVLELIIFQTLHFVPYCMIF